MSISFLQPTGEETASLDLAECFSAAVVRADEAGDELWKFGGRSEKISEVVKECGQGAKGQTITV